MKIQDVSERTGLSIHTLRYYEHAGLITPIVRAANGHRDYTEDDVAWLMFVTRLRATGMPLAQIQRYAVLAKQGPETFRERLEILEAHRQAVTERMEEERKHLELICAKIAQYRALNCDALAASDAAFSGRNGSKPTGEPA